MDTTFRESQNLGLGIEDWGFGTENFRTSKDSEMTGRLRVSDDVVFRELDGESVLLNLDSGTYFGLDEVGTRFWQLIEQDERVDVALATLEQEYDVPVDVLRADVERLVSALVGKGLMVPGEDVDHTAR